MAYARCDHSPEAGGGAGIALNKTPAFFVHPLTTIQGRVLCITMMRDYLKDFWRHNVEKAEGEARLWQAITHNRNWWWASGDEVPSMARSIENMF